MRRLLALTFVLAMTGPIQAAGILIPKEKEVPPLAMLNHKVTITIDDQVAVTKVEQIFRNHTNRQLEATYIFPVPKGASVQKFSMWVDGEKVDGELVEAKKAREIYTQIVQQTKDPGLLEYIGQRMLKMRVFPIKPKADQKVSFQYISTATNDNGLIQYTYPLKTDGKAVQTLEKFSIQVDLKSQHAVQNIYSPTHAITVNRSGDKQAKITFEKDGAKLDRNFQLYYTAGRKDVAVTTITHRPMAGSKGHFMMLVSPREELSKEQHVPRDVVFVLDTSGSMRGKRIEQARNALNYCLGNLHKTDRFAVIHFATTINRYHQEWTKASEENLTGAKKWVNGLSATGGTNINVALTNAFQMRTKEKGRVFTIVFFTDGQPTVGVTNTKTILKNVQKLNTTTTRIFTFGVGDDVNATMLDEMAEQSRAVSTFVREAENIEDKVSRLYNKISHPVLTGLKLVINGVTPSEVYPPELPDLFHGTQLVVIGRYDGYGHAAVKLTGSVGDKDREFVYEVDFPKKSKVEKPFVEDLWARRKVGYLLDQIRRNGEQKELVEEVVTLAKRYGITTPYTSYLIVPDAPVPVARRNTKTPARSSKPKVAFNLPQNPPPLPGGNGFGGNPGNAKFGSGGRGSGFGGFGGGTPPGLQPRPGQGIPGGFGRGGIGGGFGGGLPGPKTGIDPSSRPQPPVLVPFDGKNPTKVGKAGGQKGGGSKGDSKKSGQGRTSPNSSSKVPTTPPKPDAPLPVTAFIKQVQKKPGDAAKLRGQIAGEQLSRLGDIKGKDAYAQQLREKQRLFRNYEEANKALRNRQLGQLQNGKLGVDLSIANNALRNQSQLTNTAVRRVQNRNLLEVGGVWIDEDYHAKLETVVVKALSKAYFRILERHPEVKDVFRLGNHLVWVTPSGKALVVDANNGESEMTDAAIDALFTTQQAKKK